MTQVRTRFAPSPTGLMHVGAVRTALFAWLLARQNDGQFILRIEDTDKVREVEGSEAHIKDSLVWLGLGWDEGIDAGGSQAPYRQSERLAIYKEWAQKLVNKGRAYGDPYSKQELDGFRDQAKAKKQPFLYRRHRPANTPVWDGTQALRFKSEPKKYSWHDAVMGDMKAGEDTLDDFILIKADGYPTYNFAHMVDDALMKISHVIRSQEFVSSMPKFLNLYEALEIIPPIFATLPFVMAIDGKKKLSKRDGAKDILDYKKEGYLPEALLNFLATLGWNDGTEQEMFSIDELVQKFSLDRVQTSPARFDETRLTWLNGQWIRRLELNDLYALTMQSRSASSAEATKSEVQPERLAARRGAVASVERSREGEQVEQTFWPESAQNANPTYKKQILAIMQDRLKTLTDLKHAGYFFEEPSPDISLIENNKQLKKISPERRAELIKHARDALENTDYSPEAIQATLNKLLESTGEKPGVLFGLIRVYLTWAPFSPQLHETIALLGKQKTLARLHNA